MGGGPHLQRAYELARAHDPHPNPRVGALVVSPSGQVIGEGAHLAVGEPHAERVALEAAGDCKDAVVYVSLEPCAHHGRTPPCADLLIERGVARVVIGAVDPDPRVSGTGVDRLREAGIEVDVIDDPEAREVDPAYFHHRETGMPLVTLKYAMTVDGSVAALDGTSKWITSADAREDAHRLRAANDAVVVGAGTMLTDDPLLDVRLPDHERRQPRAIVIAGERDLPEDARIWMRRPLVVSVRERDIPAGALQVVAGDRWPDPVASCRAIGDAGYLSLLIEGGPRLAAAWWRAGVIDRGVVYIGAKVAGGRGMPALDGVFDTIDGAAGIEITAISQVGPDVRIDFRSGS